MQLRPIVPAVLAAALLVACGKDSMPPQPVVQAVPGARVALAPAERVTAVAGQAAWLRQHMPAGAIGYLRLPSLWGSIAGTAGEQSRTMVLSPASVEALGVLREAFGQDELIARLNAGVLPWLLQQDSPLELVVLAPNAQNGMNPEVVVSVQTRLRTADTLAPVLANILDDDSFRFDADGQASIDYNDTFKLHLHFDATSARLWLGYGGTLDAARLARMVQDSATATANASLDAVEKRLDPNGNGVLLWADLVSYRMLLNAMPTEARALQAFFAQANAFGLAAGSDQKTGSLALHARFDSTPWPGPAPTAHYDFSASGTPRWVFTLMLPTAVEIDALLAGIDKSRNDEEVDPVRVNAAIKEASGLDLAGWLAPFGREILSVRDDAGVYSAVRLRDRAALQTLLDTLTSRHRATQRSHNHRSRALHQLVLPGDLGQEDLKKDLAELGMPQLDAWIELFTRVNNNVYWYEEGDWLVFAEVPQPLMARIDGAGVRQSVHDWLVKSQGDDRSRALLSLSTELRDMPSFMYQFYLGAVGILSDIAKTPVDLFKLPTAQQLGLPEFSGLGAQIEVDEHSLTLEMNYQSSALEPMFASGASLATVAALGMTAAIALPAYQDYRERAAMAGEDLSGFPGSEDTAVAQPFDLSGADPVVATALTAAFPLQSKVTALHLVDETLPAASAVADAWPVPFGDGAGQIEYEDGALILRFLHTGTPQLDGTHLVLMPEESWLGHASWTCGEAWYKTPNEPLVLEVSTGSLSTVPVELLPEDCKP